MMKKQSMRGRRQFMKSAAVLAAAPMIVPSTVFGQTAPSNRITMGVIGCGSMGNSNIDNFLKLDDVQIIGTCDVDKNRLNETTAKIEKAYAEKKGVSNYAGCKGTGDFRDLIARQDIDAVLCALPDHWHSIPAVTAANAKKDIYGEKPLARTIAEGRAIVNAVEKNNVIWQTGSWQRSQPHFRQACELVRNGKIGKLTAVEVGLPTGRPTEYHQEEPIPAGFDYDFWLGPAPWAPYTEQRCHWNFRWILDYSGGQLTDWAGHHIDIAHWGADKERTGPVEIQGEGVYPREGLWDAVTEYRFECLYEDGLKLTVANNEKIPMGAKFIGTEGWVHVDRRGMDTEPKSLLTAMTGPDEIHLYKSNNHWSNFIECVKTRKQTITPPEVAQRSISVGHLGDIAMQLGRKLNWDPAKERFVNDPEADRMLQRPMRAPWCLPV